MAFQHSKMLLWDIQIVLVSAVSVLILTWYLNFVWKRREMFRKSWNVPGPLNLPLIGVAYMFICKPEDILGRITALQQKYPVFKTWFANRLVYFLTDPNHIDKVLNNNKLLEKEYLYRHLSDVVGTGLMTAPVPKWKRHRKTISPSFNQKVLDSFVPIFAEQSMTFVKVLKNHAGKEIDLYGMMSRCTLDILCETALGLKMNVQTTNADYGETFDKIMELTFIKIFQVWNHVDLFWKMSPNGKQMKIHVKKFNDLTDTVIREKQQALEMKKKHVEVNTEQGSLKRLAFLDLILENSSFTQEELREEVNIFLFAGTDTTASTMSFLFTVLGMYPNVQQKVLEEVLEIMGPDRQPEPNDLSQMKYTERVIKETLRLFPVGAFFLRAITEDIDLGDYVMPKGASAFFGTVQIHRNPKYWPDPLRFDPDRFLPEEIAKRHPCAYIPFSMGPRNCIGMKYAIMNMKTIVACVIREFKINSGYKSIEEVGLKANIVLRFKDGAKVSMDLRHSDT